MVRSRQERRELTRAADDKRRLRRDLPNAKSIALRSTTIVQNEKLKWKPSWKSTITRYGVFLWPQEERPDENRSSFLRNPQLKIVP